MDDMAKFYSTIYFWIFAQYDLHIDMNSKYATEKPLKFTERILYPQTYEKLNRQIHKT